MNKSISWAFIAEAINEYTSNGFFYMEVPWTVSQEAINVTLPKNCTATMLSTGEPLVGSAEQSFLQLILEQKLFSGKYVAATPCFRDEIEDEYHHKYFFKVELIKMQIGPFKDVSHEIFKMATEAMSVFRIITSYAPKLNSYEIVKTENGLDILLNGIEIGSYGHRNLKVGENEIHWIYGTGLAEPRFSQARKL